jgi:hypothetical protein
MFLGNKKYIYEYVDFKNGETKIVSVWAGVKRDSLTWNDFENLSKSIEVPKKKKLQKQIC